MTLEWLILYALAVSVLVLTCQLFRLALGPWQQLRRLLREWLQPDEPTQTQLKRMIGDPR